MMAMLAYVALMIITIVLAIAFLGYCRKNSSLPYNLPLVGMLPALAPHFHRFHEKAVEILGSSCGTFQFQPKSSCFLNMNILLTSNPANVHHVMSQNFSVYPKGDEWRKRFDIFGDSGFNFDFEKWNYYRKLVRGFLNHQKLQELMPKVFEDSFDVREIFSYKKVPYFSFDGHFRLKGPFEGERERTLGLAATSQNSCGVLVGVNQYRERMKRTS
ncbi:hypothetical protein DITRI_Ditri03aG0136000 [Diplodiscus trichospermus]